MLEQASIDNLRRYKNIYTIYCVFLSLGVSNEHTVSIHIHNMGVYCTHTSILSVLSAIDFCVFYVIIYIFILYVSVLHIHDESNVLTKALDFSLFMVYTVYTGVVTGESKN